MITIIKNPNTKGGLLLCTSSPGDGALDDQAISRRASSGLPETMVFKGPDGLLQVADGARPVHPATALREIRDLENAGLTPAEIEDVTGYSGHTLAVARRLKTLLPSLVDLYGDRMITQEVALAAATLAEADQFKLEAVYDRAGTITKDDVEALKREREAEAARSPLKAIGGDKRGMRGKAQGPADSASLLTDLIVEADRLRPLARDPGRRGEIISYLAERLGDLKAANEWEDADGFLRTCLLTGTALLALEATP